MEQYDVPAKCLEIEITESVFMQDLAPLVESICQLKNRGFSVAEGAFSCYDEGTEHPVKGVL